NDQELVFGDQRQRPFFFAGITAASIGQLPTHVEAVAVIDAFVLIDGDAGGHIHLDFNSGGGHRSVLEPEERGACSCSLAYAAIGSPPRAVLPRIAPINGRAKKCSCRRSRSRLSRISS